jgi:uncharacterized membrane protein YdjX (TVP38/TMEM64 family)
MFTLLIAVLLYAGNELAIYALRAVRVVETMGNAGKVAFILLYALATIAFIPASLLSLAAGAVFGIVQGSILVFIGATIGETAAFLIARHAARGAVERRIAQDARFESLDRAIAAEGSKIVLLLRLSPLIPFNLLNYALGLTRIRLRDFLLASLGILPGVVLYVYAGFVIGDVAAIVSGVELPETRGNYLLLAIGLIASVLVVGWLAVMARNAWERAR